MRVDTAKFAYKYMDVSESLVGVLDPRVGMFGRIHYVPAVVS